MIGDANEIRTVQNMSCCGSSLFFLFAFCSFFAILLAKVARKDAQHGT